jgi:hypothetical protein
MNAKQELLEALKRFEIELEDIKKAQIGFEREWKIEYTTTENTQELLETLDHNYDNGYGSQELYGTIIISKEIWLSRREYDGSEWWTLNKCPEI